MPDTPVRHRGGRRPRIVVAGIHAESNPRNDRPILRADFEEVAGAAVLNHRDFVDLRTTDLTLVGCYRARSVSGGPVHTAALAALTAEVLAHVTSVDQVDGILLCTHGAMRTEDDADADGTWISAVRANTPASVPIVGVFDTHGTPSLETLAALDAVTTYRTVPHVDQIATMQRALLELRRRIDGAARPHMAFEALALCLPSERAHTHHGPLRQAIDQLQSLPDGVISAEVFMGQAWAPVGVPTVGVVAYGSAESDARRFAKRMADDLWRQRDQFDYSVPALDLDGIAERLNRTDQARFVIADSGDVPGAGARGDRLDMVELALAFERIPSLIVGVAIPAWIEACSGHPAGAAVELRHPVSDTSIDARILTPVRELGAHGRCAVLAMRHVTLLVVDWRGDPPERSLLESVGIDIEAYPLIVLKTGFVPDAYLGDRHALLALSPGMSEHRLDGAP